MHATAQKWDGYDKNTSWDLSSLLDFSFFKGFGSFVSTHITAPVSLKRKLLLHLLSNMANINLALHPIEIRALAEPGTRSGIS